MRRAAPFPQFLSTVVVKALSRIQYGERMSGEGGKMKIEQPTLTQNYSPFPKQELEEGVGEVGIFMLFKRKLEQNARHQQSQEV